MLKYYMDLITADILGHIGYVVLAFGMLLIAKKQKAGWVFRAIGEFLWIIVGFGLGLTSVWGWGILFLFMEAYGYRKWGKDQNSPDCPECGKPKNAHLPL